MLPVRNLVALVLLTLMWGVNWPVMKLSLREMTPLYFRAVTMTGGVLLLIGWYRNRGAKLALPPGSLPRGVMLLVPNILG